MSGYQTVNEGGFKFKWLALLAACLIAGCTSLPDRQRGIWPWEYGQGKGEPNIPDHLAFRAGVASFDSGPQAVKPITPETVTSPPTAVPPSAGEAASAAAPAPASDALPAPPPAPSHRLYDVMVRAKKAVTPSELLLGATGPSAHDITAVNNGFAPVTVVVDLEPDTTRNTATDKALPHYAVVQPGTEQTLVHVGPKRKDSPYSFSYHSSWSFGDMAARHDCPELYRVPFGEKVLAYASGSTAKNTALETRYAVIFAVPPGTPVLAARKGRVVRIGSDGSLDILHDDRTIGTYRQLGAIADTVAIGTSVSVDDQLGIAGATGTGSSYLQFTVWRPEPAAPDLLQDNTRRFGLVAASIPIPFSIAGSATGTVLIRGQTVTRGKLPAAKKQPKRK